MDLLSLPSLQIIILSYFMLFLSIILMLSKSSCLFSSYFPWCCLSCQKSALNHNIFKSIDHNQESVLTRCLYNLSSGFTLYLTVRSANWDEFMNFKFFTTLQYPQHVMIIIFHTVSFVYLCLSMYYWVYCWKFGNYFYDIGEDLMDWVIWCLPVAFWWNL